jgi:predicted peptidase
MTAFKLLMVVLSCGVCLGLARARAASNKETHGFLDRVHQDADGKEAKYVLFVPQDYEGSKPSPLILFLHGSGESGTDGKKQAEVGLGKAIRKRAKDFPFLVIFPQSQKRTWRAAAPDAQRALDILAAVQKEYKVDAKRIYLTGLSMGGFGTWSLAAKYPERWAAIVPICGGGNPQDAPAIKHIPCWCFHGDADKAVSVARSRQMITALKEAGGSPEYNEYAGVGHNSWDKAYGTPELYEWLLQQRLK